MPCGKGKAVKDKFGGIFTPRFVYYIVKDIKDIK